MSDQRRHTRMKVSIPVNLHHPELGEASTQTRDMSDGGLFVYFERDQHEIDQGEKVAVQVAHLLGDGETAPVVSMKVIRVEETGLGLEFLELAN